MSACFSTLRQKIFEKEEKLLDAGRFELIVGVKKNIRK